MTEQRPMFDQHVGRDGIPRDVPARQGDPESSWVAGRGLRDSGRQAEQQTRAFALVTTEPRTAAELAHGDYRLEIMLRKRLPELRDLGRVRNGVARDGVQTWRLA